MNPTAIFVVSLVLALFGTPVVVSYLLDCPTNSLAGLGAGALAFGLVTFFGYRYNARVLSKTATIGHHKH